MYIFNHLLLILLILLPCISYAQDDSAVTPAVCDDVSEPAAVEENSTESQVSPNDDTSAAPSDLTSTTDQPADSDAQAQVVIPLDHKLTIAPFPLDYVQKGTIETSLGTLTCELYAGAHPLTVLNFISLGRDNYGWSDESGTMHQTAYYSNLPFGSRVKGAYVTSSVREEGTNFVLADERCESHQPVAGAIVMVQNHPGMASTQFALLARDIPVFKGMYIVFGQCGPVELIDKLTREDAVIEKIVF